MRPPLGSFGSPPDPVAGSALLIGVIVLALVAFRPERMTQIVTRFGPRRCLTILTLAAALLSAGYVAYYLRGGPRIVDATSYWLEARTLAGGSFALPAPFPSAAWRGRFLLPSADGSALFAIFPPGYPLLLAAGFVLGAPLLVGPALAALLVLATYASTKQLLGKTEVALLAALLSTLSVALRYHTADTMSHGLAALLLTLVLLCAGMGSWRSALLAGLAAGWLVATRPVSGLVGVIVGLLLVARKGKSALAALALGTLPGVLLFEHYQLAVTGSGSTSAQSAYYALADGPPGCFRYGFGASIGCKVEHGSFVRAQLADGYGLLEAIGTTARRLYWHLADAANFEPFFLLVPVAVWLGFRETGIRWLGLAVLGVVVGYAPFYFDGSYPGGGARFFADALPCEHALIAWGLVRLGWARWAAPAALLGFALHTSFDHRRLAEREGGRPMFEPALLERAGVDRGLVFVSTDHGFNLGHEPGRFDATRSVVVARRRGDAHDHLLWQRLGRPAAYRYVFDLDEPATTPRLEPYSPVPSLRFEAEAEWPPLALRGGWGHVAYPAAQCVSGRRSVTLRPNESAELSATVELGTTAAGTFELWLGLPPQRGRGELTVTLGALRYEAALQETADCTMRQAGLVRLSPGAQRVALGVKYDSAAIDFLELRKISDD